MRYRYKVIVDISNDTPATADEIATIIKADIGSWEGTLPAEERIHITKIRVSRMPYKRSKRSKRCLKANS